MMQSSIDAMKYTWIILICVLLIVSTGPFICYLFYYKPYNRIRQVTPDAQIPSDTQDTQAPQ